MSQIVSWPGGQWYTLDFAPDGAGTFDISAVTQKTTIIGGPEGFIYVPPGSPHFTDFKSMLVAEWSNGKIAAYQIDADGEPIPETRTDFILGLVGAESAVIDPLTGDFLFSTFGGGNHVAIVRGFASPCSNGQLDGTEECDDGNTVNGDGCSAQCKIESRPVCGNGTVEEGEQCDDGNTTSGDGCSASCKLESSGTPPIAQFTTTPTQGTVGQACSSLIIPPTPMMLLSLGRGTLVTVQLALCRILATPTPRAALTR